MLLWFLVVSAVVLEFGEGVPVGLVSDVGFVALIGVGDEGLYHVVVEW